MIKISSRAMWENEDKNLNHVELRPHGRLNLFWELGGNTVYKAAFKDRYFVWIPLYGLSLNKEALSAFTVYATTTSCYVSAYSSLLASVVL